MNTHFPLVPGWDVAGVVERVGFDVEEYAPGDEVFGCIRKDSVQHGAYAEPVSAHVRMLARKPAALTWEQAAAVPLAGLTAYQAVKRVGVRAGDTAGEADGDLPARMNRSGFPTSATPCSPSPAPGQTSSPAPGIWLPSGPRTPDRSPPHHAGLST
ncbi:hypothetical protein GCM10010377_61600 [Streptomyces viridiviolaceus]|nr:hypothetical protein GCM10010377_61600 [Streptomyces viridiviolaceus]